MTSTITLISPPATAGADQITRLDLLDVAAFADEQLPAVTGKPDAPGWQGRFRARHEGFACETLFLLLDDEFFAPNHRTVTLYRRFQEQDGSFSTYEYRRAKLVHKIGPSGCNVGFTASVRVRI